ncbi:hypothetical protein MKZ38_004167 [Zalerion maritima]|uniref:ABM domain-containing protein n=1 Tax=Zalerion maritima TaxID=339359 RepID=A0AAD5RLP1_9PEZI|nr:hypothetical protein MKZ38_004167 [Zalerion maritima]
MSVSMSAIAQQPSTPQFYVVARVVGSKGSFKRWSELLVHLCGVSATEPQGNSYYWGQDVDGREPDTLWGLEGYSHAIGFFTGHPSSQVFQAQMSLVDSERLLAEDYDLHHYDLAGGFLSRSDDEGKNRKDGFVAVLHFWAKERQVREVLVGWLNVLARKTREEDAGNGVQSCAVLRECNDLRMATLWLRTTSKAAFEKFQTCASYKAIVDDELEADGKLVERTEMHRSQAFIGHIDKTPLVEQLGTHEINFGRVKG